MFDSLKATIADLLSGRTAPEARRGVLADMKQALVHARLGVEDLETGVAQTRARLAREREEQATMERRRALAEGIADAETAALAAKHAAQHAERAAVLARKLEAQEAEAALARRDYEEMLGQLKAAQAGAGSGLGAGSAPVTDRELGLDDDGVLRGEIDALDRSARRAEREAAADAALEALKKRMGQG